MNTPTHIIVACALLSRKSTEHNGASNTRLNWSVIFGALLPDLSIFIFFAWAVLFTDATMQSIWGELYWTEPWQTLSAISNSIPIIVLMLGIAWWKDSSILKVIALAMLAHIALDLPFHADDAHKHFWPITDFRFHSPFSYWDIDHHTSWVSLLECTILFIGGINLMRRFKNIWIRILAMSPAIIQSGFILTVAIRAL